MMAAHQLAGVLALLVSGTVAGAPAEWLILENPYFRAYTTATRERASELMQELDQFREAVQIVTNLRIPADARRTDVLILGKDFDTLQSSRRTFGFATSTAPDEAGRIGTLIVMPASKLGVNEKVVIRHEYVHVLNRYRPLRYPVWYEEGSAEVFAYTTIRDGTTIVIDVPSDRIRNFKRVAGVGLETWMSFDRIVSQETRSAGGLRDTYLQYWFLTHYLIFGNPALAPELEKSLIYFDAGMPPLTAFTKAFGRTPESMWDGELSRYRRQIKSTRYALRKPITGEPFAIRADTGGEGEAMLAVLRARRETADPP